MLRQKHVDRRSKPHWITEYSTRNRKWRGGELQAMIKDAARYHLKTNKGFPIQSHPHFVRLLAERTSRTSGKPKQGPPFLPQTWVCFFGSLRPHLRLRNSPKRLCNGRTLLKKSMALWGFMLICGVVWSNEPSEITCKRTLETPNSKSTCLSDHTVDGRNPAPPKKPWNEDSPVNTNKLVSHGFNAVQNEFRNHPRYGADPTKWTVSVSLLKHHLLTKVKIEPGKQKQNKNRNKKTFEVPGKQK